MRSLLLNRPKAITIAVMAAIARSHNHGKPLSRVERTWSRFVVVGDTFTVWSPGWGT